MSIYAPVYRKLKYSGNSLITRSLPVKGDFVVKEGDTVVPFTKLGRSKVSDKFIVLPPKVKLEKRIEDAMYIYKDERIGRMGFKKVTAPYNGYITKNEAGEWVFNEELHDVWILSGVWGTVERVIRGQSAIIKTKTVDISFVANTQTSFMGELIVFPNPSALLDMEYLQKFASNTQNKVIYIGNHIRKQIVELAAQTKTGAIIGGSIEKSSFNLAKQLGVNVSITTGFGHYDTPEYIFEYLKNVSNRHVFVNGEKGMLQVPMPPENKFTAENPVKNDCLREIIPGVKVITFNKENFGETGVVDRVQEETIYVKLNKSDKIAETRIPNIFALE